MSELKKVYIELETLLGVFRIEWEKDHKAGLKRKESYWQGKKDGVRIAMNLIHPLIIDEKQNTIQ